MTAEEQYQQLRRAIREFAEAVATELRVYEFLDLVASFLRK